MCILDFTAVFSITNCKNSWETFYSARNEKLLLIALTDSDCPRFPRNEGLMVSKYISYAIPNLNSKNLKFSAIK